MVLYPILTSEGKENEGWLQHQNSKSNENINNMARKEFYEKLFAFIDFFSEESKHTVTAHKKPGHLVFLAANK